jgi:hypothetical protein
MTKARIEIVARPIVGFEKLGKFAPHHLYILHTRSNYEQIVIRGGPEGGDRIKNWINDNVKVTKEVYNDKHPDWEQAGVIHYKHLLDHGSDIDIDAYVNNVNFQKTFDFINKGNFDYKIAGITYGSWQNSNAIAKIMTEAMGLKFNLPIYQNSKGKNVKVWAPGFDDNLQHTFVDIFTNPSVLQALHSNNFRHEVSPDFKTISYIDKESGIKVYVQETKAIKLGDAYIVEGFSQEQVASQFNVPLDNVIENYSFNLDITGRAAPIKSFIITPGTAAEAASSENMNQFFELVDKTMETNKEFQQQHINSILDFAFKQSSQSESNQQVIANIFDAFANPEINNPELNSAQRFSILAQKEKDTGNSGFGTIYENLAKQQEMVMALFGEEKDNLSENN